jgi:tetratricopeptide (TPR) repeat protein
LIDKHFLISILLFLLLAPALSAQQARFDSANELLQESEYANAIHLYHSIAEDGFESGALWLNLGIAYSQMDSLGVAKYYLLKAKQFKDTSELADDALLYVNERFSRRSAVLPPLPWNQFINFLSGTFGLNAIVITGLLFFYVGVGLLIWSWFRIDLNKALRNGSYISFGLMTLLLLFSWIIYYQDNRFSTAVMIDRQSVVYEQPNESSSVITTAFEGYTMRVDFKAGADYPEWKYVRLENGMFGWVKSEGLKIL